MAQGEMVYNTEKGNLEIPEYGRNVQNMIHYLKNIEEKDLKQAYAEEIINLFAIMYPANRHLADYKEKLWNHLFRIAKYDLDLQIPEGIVIQRKDRQSNFSHMDYPQTKFSNRHYGKYIQNMIKDALAMEDIDKRNGYKEVIASYMKLAYRTWNKEHFVSDDIIIQDLKEMSNNQLVFEEDYSIENLVSMKNKLGVGSTAPLNLGWRKFGNKNNNNNNNRNNNNNNNLNKKKNKPNFKKKK